ncbi:MAG: TraR/DksA family transcriptional regulator [Rhodothermaceae bacterium]
MAKKGEATGTKKVSAAKKSTATKKAAAKTTAGAKKTSGEVEVVTKTKKVKKVKGYPKRELNEFKKIILEKRQEILEQLQNLKDQMMDPTTGQYVNENSPYSLHMAEQGTDSQEREKLYLWAQRENKFLGYLEDALLRIENGTYGICIASLDDPEPHLVPKPRLLAVPHTQLCVACKEKQNKR